MDNISDRLRNDARAQDRLKVLREWFDLARRAGHSVPLDSELMEIARDAQVGDQRQAENVEAWRMTTEWLLKQLRFGLAAPIEQLPNELRVPTPGTQEKIELLLKQLEFGTTENLPNERTAPAPGAQEGINARSTSDPKLERRRSVLGAWADSARQRGDDVPDDAELEEIAQTATVPRDEQTASVEAWRRTLEWILQQLAFGITNPQQQIPTELMSPRSTSAVIPATPETPAVSPELLALRSWRRAAVERKVPAIAQLKDSHLRQIANSKWRTATEIKDAFGPVIGKFSDQLAAALSGLEDQTGVASEPAIQDVRVVEPVSRAAEGTSASRTITPSSGGEEFNWEGFALYEFGPAGEVPTALRTSRAAEGSVRVAWDTPRESAIFRLVSSDQHAPMSPDSAQRVDLTLGSSALDTREFVHAVRHYQVWRNEGTVPGEAMHSQPELHALGAIVAPVPAVEIREDEGRTIGQWNVLEGTHQVQVFRIPVRNAIGASGDPAYRILSEAPNLGGFVDIHPVRGEQYLYQVFAEAVIDGISQLSAPVSREIKISLVHKPVLDLSFHLHGEGESRAFDLSWSKPAGGQVKVYRTRSAPKAGIEREAQHESVLIDAGLAPDSLLAHPILTDDGRSAVVNVPWPKDWTRAYFTVVVLQDGQAFVGNTVRGVSVPSVTNPKITERVNRQILTFDWPSGADVVQVFRSPADMDPALATQGEAIEISESDYREKGGLSFQAGELGVGESGVGLHIVAVAFDGGQRTSATPRTLVYFPILRLSYQVSVKRTLSGKQYAIVSIASEIRLERTPHFVLVHNPSRLPLTLSDGTQLKVERDHDVPGEPTRRFTPGALTPDFGSQVSWRTNQSSWNQEVKSPSGFLRLFLALSPEQLKSVALLDPPVSSLKLMSRREQAQGAFNG
jgi:hypothetical protein